MSQTESTLSRLCLGVIALLAALSTACSTQRPARLLTPQEMSSPPTLMVGDPAPPIVFEGWAQGEPIAGFEPGRVYVLDFWAPWCGPCIAAMPHLSALQERFAGDVVIVAVGIVDESSSPSWIRRTVGEVGPDLRVRVAIDEDCAATEAYRVAVRDLAIPRSFIVDRAGRLAWYGHPMKLDAPLAAVVDGTWDIEAAARDAERRGEVARVTRAHVAEYLAADQRGDAAAMLASAEAVSTFSVEEAQGMSPPWWAWTARVRLLVNSGRVDEATKVARDSMDVRGVGDEPVALAEMATTLAPQERATSVALAERAVTLVKASEAAPPTDSWAEYIQQASMLQHAAALADAATALAAAGRFDEAIELQRIAVGRWPENPHLIPSRAELTQALNRYEAAAGRR
ncbi:MAG: TlpA disulfide reductase family protein [Phycisphaerales bacterium]